MGSELVSLYLLFLAGIFVFTFICPDKLLHFKCILGKKHNRGIIPFVRNLVLNLMDIIAYLPVEIP